MLTEQERRIKDARWYACGDGCPSEARRHIMLLTSILAETKNPVREPVAT